MKPDKKNGIIQKRLGFFEWYIIENGGWFPIALICLVINIASFSVLAFFDKWWNYFFAHVVLGIGTFMFLTMVLFFFYAGISEWFEIKKEEYEYWARNIEGENDKNKHD